MKKDKPTQEQQVLWLLMERGLTGLTPLEALREAGCFRLAAVIFDLRAAGYNISTENHKTESGKYVARYVLQPAPEVMRFVEPSIWGEEQVQ